MFGNSQVDAKALAFPSFTIAGKKLKPVVVKTSQAASPTGSNEDSQLVPVGPQELEAGNTGRWFNNFQLPFWKKDKPKDDGKRFPLRLFHLVDVSASMERKLREVKTNPTRLDYVKKSLEKFIRQIPQSLKGGIEHVLIPYGDNIGKVQVFSGKQEKQLLKAVNALSKISGTNIFKPIEEVVSFIKKSGQEGMRNLAILFSDGEHWPRTQGAETIDDVLQKFSELEAVNSAAFNVGVSSGYKRGFMVNATDRAKFAGLAHIPNSKGDANLYEHVLPEFVQDLTSAPQYPIISFNSYFDQVINANPTARQVNKSATDEKTKEVTEDSEHFEAIAGFQTEAFNIGFTEEDKIDDARIFKLVKDKANSTTFDETEELTIQDFDQAILDPSEREQYQNYLIIALKNLLLDTGNPAEALENFLAENKVPDYIRMNLEALLEKLQAGPMGAQDENSLLSAQSAIVSINRTVMDGLPISLEAPDQGDLNTMRAMGSNTHIGTQQAFEQLGVNSLESVVQVPNVNIKGLRLKFTNLQGDEIDSVRLEENQTLTIGRENECDITLNDERCSRFHAKLELKAGKVFVTDLESSNGTALNGNLISKKTRVKPEDILKLGHTSLKVSFRE